MNSKLLTNPRLFSLLLAGCLALAGPAARAADEPATLSETHGESESQPQPLAPPPSAPANYADRPEVQRFVDTLVQKHGFERTALLDLFRQARMEPSVLKAILPPPSPGVRSWKAYRSRFIEPRRIRQGMAFRQAHADALKEAEAKFGVPEDVIVAIIGIETFYGRNTGRYQAFSALTTLAFDYPPRADLFRRELEELLLLAREAKADPLSYTGSFAGALGLPQFLPSSLRRYAVDFDGDGRIDLSGNPVDAIGSVASFLSRHGWETGAPVAVPARIDKGKGFEKLADGGVEPRFLRADLKSHGITTAGKLDPARKAAVIDLATPKKATEYWLGFQNFYTITRYNRSSFYAMSVYQLSERIRKGEVGKEKPVKKAAKKRKGKKG